MTTSPESFPDVQLFPLEPQRLGTSLAELQDAGNVSIEKEEAVLKREATIVSENENLHTIVSRVGAVFDADDRQFGDSFFATGALLTHYAIRTASMLPGTIAPLGDAETVALKADFAGVFDTESSLESRITRLEEITDPHMAAEPSMEALINKLFPDARQRLRGFYLGAATMTTCLRRGLLSVEQ